MESNRRRVRANRDDLPRQRCICLACDSSTNLTAATQFRARFAEALIKTELLPTCRLIGNDAHGSGGATAARVATHVSNVARLTHAPKGPSSLFCCKRLERNPDFDWSDWAADLRDAGKSLELLRVLLSPSRCRQPALQQPGPSLAKQSCIL